jgi:hypothetical protein
MVARAAVVAALLLAVAAGCGGDDENDATQQWASSVCTDLNDWVTSIQSTVKELTDKGLSMQKSDVQAAVDDAQTATDDLVSELKNLDVPDDSAAQEAKGELEQLGNEVQEQVDNVKEASASNTGAVQLAQTVASAVSASAAEAKSTFETIQSLDAGEDVKQAFEDAESCDTLRDSINNLG